MMSVKSPKAVIQVLQGTYPNSIIYQPETLRQRVIETYGMERFKKTLEQHIINFEI
jgi:hypothetical protein